MLHRRALHESGKVIALHLDNGIVKACICNQGGTVSLSLSRLACGILNLANENCITLHVITAYIPTHLSMEASYLLQGRLVPECHFLPCIDQVAFHLWGQVEMDLLASSYTNHCQHYYTLEKPFPPSVLGMNAFNHPWTYQVICIFPPAVLVPLVMSSFLECQVAGPARLLNFLQLVEWSLLAFPQLSMCGNMSLISVPS